MKQERRKRSPRETMTARSECLSSIKPNKPHCCTARDWRDYTHALATEEHDHTVLCSMHVLYACMHECMYVQNVFVPLVRYLPLSVDGSSNIFEAK